MFPGKYFPITTFRRLIAHTRLTFIFYNQDVPAPDPKRPNAPLALPAASRFFSKRKTRPDCLPIQSGETETRPRDDDDETFVSPWQAGDDAETLRETDDTTDGAMDVDDSRVSSFPTGNTSHEPVSLVGAVAVFRGANGGWRAHELLIRQAPRLVLLAQAAGAVAAVFLNIPGWTMQLSQMRRSASAASTSSPSPRRRQRSDRSFQNKRRQRGSGCLGPVPSFRK